MESNYVSNFETQPPHMTVSDWIITFIISAIPVVNIIMFFVWAIGAKNPSKRSFYRANILLWVIIFVIVTALMWLGFTLPQLPSDFYL